MVENPLAVGRRLVGTRWYFPAILGRSQTGGAFSTASDKGATGDQHDFHTADRDVNRVIERSNDSSKRVDDRLGVHLNTAARELNKD